MKALLRVGRDSFLASEWIFFPTLDPYCSNLPGEQTTTKSYPTKIIHRVVSDFFHEQHLWFSELQFRPRPTSGKGPWLKLGDRLQVAFERGTKNGT